MNNSIHFPKRPLLYIDFLGFSGKVLTQSLFETMAMYQKYLTEISPPRSMQPNLKYDLVSDSLFVWSDEDVSVSMMLKSLIHFGILFYHNLQVDNILTRGSISFGEFIIKDHNFPITNNLRTPIHLIIGNAIVKAAKWEQSQNIACISFEPSCLDELKKHAPNILEEAEANHFLIQYSVPNKKTRPKKTLVLNPFTDRMSHMKLFKGNLQKMIRKSKKQVRIVRKLRNTLNFIKHIEINNLVPDDRQNLVMWANQQS